MRGRLTSPGGHAVREGKLIRLTELPPGQSAQYRAEDAVRNLRVGKYSHAERALMDALNLCRKAMREEGT